MAKNTKPKNKAKKHPAPKAPATKANANVRPAIPTATAPRRHGLGRGLDALLSSPSAITAASLPVAPTLPATGKADASASKGVVLSVPVGEIAISPWQPRNMVNEETEAFSDLVTSIRAHGIIQPLVCRKLASGSYELIAGNRRLNAAKKAELTEVPVVLLDAEDRDAAEMALIENVQREDLNPIEEAEAYHQLALKFNLTQEEIADRVGKARPSVGNALRLLDLSDEIKQHLSARTLSTGHAKLLLSVNDEEMRLRLATLAVTEGWSVKALEDRIRRLRAEPKPVRVATPDIPAAHVQLLERKLRELVASKVRLYPSVRYANGRHSGGKVEIDFSDNIELDGILSRLGINVNEGIF